MAQYKVTDQFRAQLTQAGVKEDQLKTLIPGESLNRHQLISIYKKHKPTKTLLELVALTRLEIPNKNHVEEKPKTKEFIKLMNRLRQEEKEREFRKLVEPKQAFSTLYENSEEAESVAQMNKEIKSYLTTIINILISVGSVVYAIWYWTETSWKLKDSYRVLMCLFFGLLILVAEVVVYMGYLNKIEESKTKERSKKEVKKLIRKLD